MFNWRLFFLFLSVCYTSRENYTDLILVKILAETYLWTRTNWLNFVSSSRSGFGIFLTDSSTLRKRAFFHNSAYISGKTDRIFMKILPYHTILRTCNSCHTSGQGSLRWFSEVMQIRTPDTDLGSGPDSPWQRCALSECSCLKLRRLGLTFCFTAHRVYFLITAIIFSFSFVVFLLISFCLLVLPYFMVNEDEYFYLHVLSYFVTCLKLSVRRQC